MCDGRGQLPNGSGTRNAGKLHLRDPDGILSLTLRGNIGKRTEVFRNVWPVLIRFANAFYITAFTIIANDTKLGLHHNAMAYTRFDQLTKRVNIIRVYTALKFSHGSGGLICRKTHNALIFVRDVLNIWLNMPVPGSGITDFFTQNK